MTIENESVSQLKITIETVLEEGPPPSEWTVPMAALCKLPNKSFTSRQIIGANLIVREDGTAAFLLDLGQPRSES